MEEESRFMSDRIYPHRPLAEENAHVQVEACWVKVEPPHTQPVIVGSIYRPPSANLEYFNAILDKVEEVSASSFDLILLGDLNYNYLVDESVEKPTALYSA